MTQPTVLWWSRSGRDYSRDRIVRQAFTELNWQITDFRPRISQLGQVQAVLTQVPRPDLVWVPCFRQRDARAAIQWAAMKNVPLVFDPLISAWDKQVFERQKFAADSRRAKLLRQREGKLFRRSTLAVADTQHHADFFGEAFQLPEDQLAVIPVSAEEAVFQPQPSNAKRERLRILFYGSFIGLQGPQHIATAAAQTSEVDWCFIGSGPYLEDCLKICAGQPHIEFISRVPYETLPARIADADILLGVFGTSQKAGRVIPNKAYQALACGRPLLSRHSDAWPTSLQQSDWPDCGLRLVEPGSPAAITAAVRELADRREHLPAASTAARQIFDQHFSNAVVRERLSDVLARVGCG
ncbi:MAG: hypothetical protein Fues2KO_12320 [Fuerstiella sp.]